MQQPSLRLANRRLKRRRAQRRANNNDAARAAPSIFDGAESDGDDEAAPVRRRILGGVKQVPEVEEKTSQNSQAPNSDAADAPPRNPWVVKEAPLPAVARSAPGEPRSQIARLMARRRASGDDVKQVKDDAAQFRDDIARCADVDEADYDVISVEKFGARMLAAMGWSPPQNQAAEADDAAPVRRPARLGLGAKLGDDGEPPPPTHSRSGPFASVLGRTASSTPVIGQPRAGASQRNSGGDATN